jgi:hypothetical protein
MRNRSMSDHPPLYAVVILALGLGTVAAFLALLAYLLFFRRTTHAADRIDQAEDFGIRRKCSSLATLANVRPLAVVPSIVGHSGPSSST